MAVESWVLDDADRRVEHLAVDVAGLLFEIRIALAAMHLGAKTLAASPKALSLEHELATLTKLSDQACEAVEILQKVITDYLSPA
jgi:hypothetical protein